MGQKTSVLLGFLTILLWASLATLGNLLIHLPPFYVLGVSFLIGSLPAFTRFRKMFPKLNVLLLGAFGYFGYHFCLFLSFRYAPALEANLLNYLWPMILVILSPIFFPEEKLKFYHFVGIFLSVLGSVILVAGKGMSFQWENFQGYALALGAAIIWPTYSVLKKKWGQSSVWSIGSFCLVSGALSLITHYFLEPRVVLQTRDAWLLLFLGLGPFGMAFYTWDLALANGDVRVIGALSYLTPVLSTFGLVFFTGQDLNTTTLTAMILILGGAGTGLLDFLPKNKIK
jgi:drug/metabolite transporter (DMT)-like permease